MKKNYIALDKYMWPINAILRRQFFGYVKQNYGINRIIIYMEYIIQKLYKNLLHPYVFNKLGSRKRSENFLLKNNIDLYYIMSQWAIGILSNSHLNYFLRRIRGIDSRMLKNFI